MSNPFRYLIRLDPLGLLYGSSGRFLSAENLVGKAGEHFPPDSPTAAGLIASSRSRSELRELYTAGPFLHHQELLLKAPLNLLQSRETDPEGWRQVTTRLIWQGGDDETDTGGWQPAGGEAPPSKPQQGGWIPLSAWAKQAAPGSRVRSDPWKSVPHLHPRLRSDERVSAQEDALFLELAIALDPDVSLAYLSSHPVTDGRYRFGGEGHLVDLRCEALPDALVDLLAQPLRASFALITPGLWGSSRLSQREPLITGPGAGIHPWHHQGQAPAILTDRPQPWRHRLGAGADGKPRLSRGRWAVPAGSCYHVAPGHVLPPWPDWDERWFPREGLSFRHFGTGLALPLP
ncbi:hypothetical protein [Vulcanococcus limneticus]|uniref:hypothetical protein n=1 Tax=Vulcanococcus limneticus TaxID=2170428 RepID=UPI00398BEC5E